MSFYTPNILFFGSYQNYRLNTKKNIKQFNFYRSFIASWFMLFCPNSQLSFSNYHYLEFLLGIRGFFHSIPIMNLKRNEINSTSLDLLLSLREHFVCSTKSSFTSYGWILIFINSDQNK